MARTKKALRSGNTVKSIRKCPTGIAGLDEITGGGFPGAGRRWCAAGRLREDPAGHGVPGPRGDEFNEPGVFMASKRRPKSWPRTSRPWASTQKLVRQNKLAIDYVHVERSEIEETGEYDLEGLFVRLGMPSTSSGPSGSSWTPWRPSSPAFLTRRSFGPNCGGSSAG